MKKENVQPSVPIPRSIRNEKKTVAAMIRIYCGARHGSRSDPCEECAALLAYAHGRLDRCPYGAGKPSCRECPVHCYRRGEREAVRDVMRFSGPKMIFRHPVLAIVHFWKDRLSRLKGVPRPPKSRSSRPALGETESRIVPTFHNEV